MDVVLETISRCSESSYETLHSTDSPYENVSVDASTDFEVASCSTLGFGELVDEKPNHHVEEPKEGSTTLHCEFSSFSTLESEDLNDAKPNHHVDEPKDGSTSSDYEVASVSTLESRELKDEKPNHHVDEAKESSTSSHHEVFSYSTLSSKELKDETLNHQQHPSIEPQTHNQVDEPIEGSTSSHYPTIFCPPRRMMVSEMSFDDLEISARSQKDPRAEFEAIKLRLNRTTFFTNEDLKEGDDLENEMQVPDATKESPNKQIESKIEPLDERISKAERRNSLKSRPTSVSCNLAGEVIENCEDIGLPPTSMPVERSEQKSDPAVITQKSRRSSFKLSQLKSTSKRAGTLRARKSFSRDATGVKTPLRRRLWASVSKFSNSIIFKSQGTVSTTCMDNSNSDLDLDGGDCGARNVAYR